MKEKPPHSVLNLKRTEILDRLLKNVFFFQNICELNNGTRENSPTNFISDTQRYYLGRGTL